MLSNAQIKKVEHSFKHGDSMVIVIEGKSVYVADSITKQPKTATIKFTECYEVNESCFQGEEYFGEVCGPKLTLIIDDPYAKTPCIVASRYRECEIKEVRISEKRSKSMSYYR